MLVDCAQVEAFLNRHEDGGEAVIKYIVDAVEELGFRSWAYRIVNTAGRFSGFQGLKCCAFLNDASHPLRRSWASAPGPSALSKSLVGFSGFVL